MLKGRLHLAFPQHLRGKLGMRLTIQLMGLTGEPGVEPRQPIMVTVGCDRESLPFQEAASLVRTAQLKQSLACAKPSINSQRPLVGVKRRFDEGEALLSLTACQLDPRPLEGNLPIQGRRRPVQQVVHGGVQPVGDDPENSDRWPAPVQLDLVEKGATEIAAGNLGQAHPPLHT